MSSSSLVPVGAVYLSVDWAVVPSHGVDPIVGLGHHPGWGAGGGALPPHEGLQLPHVVPDVREGGWHGLGDGGVPGGYTGLRGSIEVSISCKDKTLKDKNTSIGLAWSFS